MLTTRDGPAVIGAKARYWSNIEIFRRNIATFGIDKPELWCGYPMVKTIVMIYLIVSTEYTNVTDRHTDRQTGGYRATAEISLMHNIARQKWGKIYGAICSSFPPPLTSSLYVTAEMAWCALIGRPSSRNADAVTNVLADDHTGSNDRQHPSSMLLTPNPRSFSTDAAASR